MKLYKENGANPLSGCLPLVAQLPLWFALLNVLRAMSENKALYGLTPEVVHEANSAKIFGATISSKFLFQHPATPGNVKVVIGFTVVISAVTTFLTVRQSMKRGMMQTPTAADDNPMAGAQKYMAYIAPLFALSGLYWQFGLVLYWLTSNIWTLGQQYFLFKKIPPLEKAPAAAPAAPAASGKAPAVAAQPAAARVKTGNRSLPAGQAPAAKPAGTAQPAGSAKAAAGQSASRGQAPAAARRSGIPAEAAAPCAKQAGRGRSRPRRRPRPPRSASRRRPPNGSGGMLRKLVKGTRRARAASPSRPRSRSSGSSGQKQSRSKRSGKR